MSYVITLGNNYYKGFHVIAGEQYPIFSPGIDAVKRYVRSSNAYSKCHDLNSNWEYWTNGDAKVRVIDDICKPDEVKSNKECDYIIHTKQTISLYSVVSARSIDEAKKKMRAALRDGNITGYEPDTDSYIFVSNSARIVSAKVVLDGSKAGSDGN